MAANSKLEKTKLASEYAWNWFSYHASQRMITFRFFLLLVGVLAVAYCQTITVNPALACGFAFLNILNSVLFWRLDHRSRDLICIGEDYLLKIEKHFSRLKMDDAKLVFMSRKTKSEHNKKSYPRRIYSHGQIFNWIFGIMTFSSSIGFAFALYKFFRLDNCLLT